MTTTTTGSSFFPLKTAYLLSTLNTWKLPQNSREHFICPYLFSLFNPFLLLCFNATNHKFWNIPTNYTTVTVKQLSIIWRKYFLFKCCNIFFNEQKKNCEQWADIEDKSSIKTTSNIKAKNILTCKKKEVYGYESSNSNSSFSLRKVLLLSCKFFFT